MGRGGGTVISGHGEQVGGGMEGQEGHGSGEGHTGGGGHEGHSGVTGEGSGVDLSLRQAVYLNEVVKFN